MFLYDVGYAPTSPRMTEARRQPRTLNEIRATMSRWVRLRNILPLSRYGILFTTSDESFFCSPRVVPATELTAQQPSYFESESAHTLILRSTHVLKD